MSVCTDEVEIKVTCKLVNTDALDIHLQGCYTAYIFMFLFEIALGKIKMILKVCGFLVSFWKSERLMLCINYAGFFIQIMNLNDLGSLVRVAFGQKLELKSPNVLSQSLNSHYNDSCYRSNTVESVQHSNEKILIKFLEEKNG